MIENMLGFLQVHVLPLGALGVFLASVVEEVAAPIPSALIMTMSGFLLVSGPVSISTIATLLIKVAIPAAFGVTIGSYFIFYIAKFGGKAIIEKFGKYIGLYWGDIESLKGKMEGSRKDEVIILITRIVPMFPSVAISAFCGIVGMNPVKYFFITFIGIFFRGIILGAIGWQLGNVYEKYVAVISKFETYMLFGIVCLVFSFLIYRFLTKKEGNSL